METLETPRLILVKYTPEDLRKVFAEHSVEEGMRLLGNNSEDEYYADKAKSDGGFTTYRSTILHFRITLKEINKVIGGCGYHNWFALHNRAEVGYHLNQDEHKGQGIMTEALQRVLQYGFEDMGLNRIEAVTAPWNKASIALLEKYGFTLEGVMKEHYRFNDTIEDSNLYRLLKSEYFG